ncbi:MAG: F0F1 ATP synthase subunit B' [Beijerinckiaceae bacterium]|nr:F0F1 ATP synthase subunit B' [Beijerinckiaceae bacterium]
MRRFLATALFLSSALPVLAAETKGGFPPFNASTFAGQLFWLALTFGTLYLLMSRVALPRVGAILAEREATIESSLAQASKAQAAAEAEAQGLEQALAKAKANAQAIAQEARTKSAREIDAKRSAVEKDLAAKMVAAEASINETKTKAMGNVEDIAKDAVSAIIEQLSGKAPTAAAVTKAINAARGE